MLGRRKPSSEIFQLACDMLNTCPEKTVFVGDSEISDIEGANNVGMYSVYMSTLGICAELKELSGIVQEAINA